MLVARVEELKKLLDEFCRSSKRLAVPVFEVSGLRSCRDWSATRVPTSATMGIGCLRYRHRS